MDNEEKEEYPGEFKDNLIKIAILIPALVLLAYTFFMMIMIYSFGFFLL